jgi:uncharacterized SAM-binding protein YcdF (DUF218 family)
MTVQQIVRLTGGLTAAAAVGGALALAVTSGRVLAAERRQVSGTAIPPSGGDILLVLGAQALPDRPSKELQARLDHAVRRWQEGAAPVIGVSGGIDGEVDEAGVMADYLVSCGVPPDAVRRVVPGENTRATMRSMAAADPAASIVAVSSPYHAHRIVAEGRRLGLRIWADCPASTPESRNSEIRRTRLAGEIIGSILYASPEGLMFVARRVSTPARQRLPRLAARAGRMVRGRA